MILNHILLFRQAKGEQVVEAKVVGDDLRHWKGKIFGPVSTRNNSDFLLSKLVT